MVPQSGKSLQAARLWQGRPDAFGMATALRRATEDGVRLLGRNDIGRLEPGGRADIAAWSGEDLADVPDALAGLVPSTVTVRCWSSASRW